MKLGDIICPDCNSLILPVTNVVPEHCNQCGSENLNYERAVFCKDCGLEGVDGDFTAPYSHPERSVPLSRHSALDCAYPFPGFLL
jgi:DNA-directed RNA polymerase subunit RPC12/RpoP